MKNFSGGGLIWMWVMSVLLMIFSGFHVFTFLKMTLPPELGFMAIFGLVAMCGGAVIWLMVFSNKGIGGAQRTVALTMIVVDLLGESMAFLADTIYNTGILGITVKMDENTMLGVIIGVSFIIIANIAMTFVFKTLDPNARADRAMGEAKHKMEAASLKELNDNMDVYAQQMAPQMAASIIEEWRVNDQINIAERRKRAGQLASNAGLNSGNPAPRQLPARKPAPVEPEYSDYEEEETAKAEPPARKPAPRRVVLADLPANPTPTRNGKQHA